ncbi:hypothetical protein EII99_15865 [Xanthomonas perforans]|nr:hypothetical protein EII99_15865 [Xanthomonas perforans]
MPRKSLQGRTCSVSGDGRRARACRVGCCACGSSARGAFHIGQSPASLVILSSCPASAITKQSAAAWPRTQRPARLAASQPSGAVSSPLAGPLAAWMPPSSLQGRIDGVSRERRGHRTSGAPGF